MLTSSLLVAATRFFVGATPRWQGAQPTTAQRIYFANHTSHLDTVALWSALPPELRARTRPVAAADYWNKGGLRRHIATVGLNVVFIDRNRADPSIDPLQPLYDALAAGDSLIIFPEGTRVAQALPGPFKSGIFHLAQRFPAVELVPVYLENLHRSMPKGSLLPIPLICTVRFGTPLHLAEGEDKTTFLTRAHRAVLELA